MSRQVSIVTHPLLHSSMPGHVITAPSCSLQASQVVASITARPVVVLITARPVFVPRHVAITALLRSSRSGPLMEQSSLQASRAGIRFVWWSI